MRYSRSRVINRRTAEPPRVCRRPFGVNRHPIGTPYRRAKGTPCGAQVAGRIRRGFQVARWDRASGFLAIPVGLSERASWRFTSLPLAPRKADHGRDGAILMPRRGLLRLAFSLLYSGLFSCVAGAAAAGSNAHPTLPVQRHRGGGRRRTYPLVPAANWLAPPDR